MSSFGSKSNQLHVANHTSEDFYTKGTAWKAARHVRCAEQSDVDIASSEIFSSTQEKI